MFYYIQYYYFLIVEDIITSNQQLNILDNSDTDKTKDITSGKKNCIFYSLSLIVKLMV